ncbi:MAG: PTS sugar transporter subunit IIB [Chloroflexi bacterium]|nr:PTS sugar transporter subunit IIB [Chloroflexota bacterium]
MTLRLVRVDDRLIHGQVVAVWLRAVGADRIVIVDDRVAADPFLVDVLTLAAPIGVPVEVLDVASAAPRVTARASAHDACFVLVKSPVTALALLRAGVPIGAVNLGGIGAGPGRRPLYRTISASDEERAALREIEALGTPVEIRIVADDRPVPFASVDRT